MKKGKIRDTRKTCHLRQDIYHEIMQFGKGNFQQGLKETKKVLCCLNNNNGVNADEIKTEILMKDCMAMMDHLQQLYPRTHYNHFGCFPPFFKCFLETGELRFSILKGGRKEKSLDELKEKKK